MTGKEIAKRKVGAEMTGAEANIAAVNKLLDAVKRLRRLVLDLTKRTASEELEIADLRLFDVCNRLKSEASVFKEEWSESKAPPVQKDSDNAEALV
jgi:hypothetical protein